MPASPEHGPESDFRSEVEKIRREENGPSRARSLAKGAFNLLLVGGGVTVVASLLVPTRTAGASRTAFLEWEKRDTEIARAAASPAPSEGPAVPAPDRK